MQILAVDIDGTIWSPWDIAAEEINRLTDNKYNLKLSDMTHYDSFYHIAGDVATHGFAAACARPEAVMDRSLYPGVVEGIHDLWNMGVKVHFITHNRNPRKMRPALHEWFENTLGVEFGLSVTQTGRKIPLMRREGAIGIIEDKPDMVTDAADAGFFVAMKLQEYNKYVAIERPDIAAFDDWSELPNLVAMELESADSKVGGVV